MTRKAKQNEKYFTVSVRLPLSTVKMMDEEITRVYPNIQHRTQLIEVAVINYLLTKQMNRNTKTKFVPVLKEIP